MYDCPNLNIQKVFYSYTFCFCKETVNNFIHLGKKEFTKYYENAIPFGCNIITAFLVALSMTLAINFVFGIGKFNQIILWISLKWT